MTGLVTNEAAERLQAVLVSFDYERHVALLHEALAAERRATVERIRQAYRKTDSYRLDEHSDNLNAILDVEAG